MEFVKVTPQYAPGIALVELNRPRELNALNLQVMQELRDSLNSFDQNQQVRVIILTGNEQAFAAGADIKQMADKGAIDMLKIDQFKTWDQIRKIQKPLIAAVSGFALGGGCELAMACDIIIAARLASCFASTWTSVRVTRTSTASADAAPHSAATSRRCWSADRRLVMRRIALAGRHSSKYPSA
jgi:enoyl-CoA hydratase/carnithine racemase